MLGYIPFEKKLDGANQVVAASQTNQVVSNEFAISSGGSIHLRVDIACDAVIAGAGITATLQHSSGVDDAGVEKWFATKTVAVTADGVVSLTFLVELAGDQAYLPLAPKGRICVTTGAGSAVTVNSVRVCQEI